MEVNAAEGAKGSDIPAGKTRGMLRVKESILKSIWFLCAIFAVVTIFFILVFLFWDGYPIFAQVGVWNFITGMTWNPTGNPPMYGIFPLIVGTVLVTIGAMVISIPLGIGSALYISELAPAGVKAVVKPAIELLAGIPSVVFGFFGLVVLTSWIQVTFDVPTGQTWLAGSILLGIMALPTIISVSEDAISSVPREFKEGSLAVGANHWQTISRVIVPGALSGITAAIILGMGRALGETMAVLMVTGNAAIIPSPIWNVLSPIRTLTGTLGIEMGEVAIGSTHFHALFGVAVVLLVITLGVNLMATAILGRIRERQMPTGEKKKNLLFCAIARSGWMGGVRNATPWIGAVLLTGLMFLLSGAGAAVLTLGMTGGVITTRRRIPPRLVQKIAFALIALSIVVVLVVLGIILWDIVSKGIGYISWDFLTQSPRDLGRAGGIFPALVGTLYLVIGAIAIALPLGLGAAVYLTEYTREGKITRMIRTGADLLNGTPSIVFGLFGFAFLVLYLNFGVSLIAGQITLALMVLPTIIRTTEEALKTVPCSVREGSLALGATKWQTISRVVIPPAMPGIITGTILSIGRAAGETAPILFTAVVFSQRFLPTSLFEPVMALPYHLYILATNVPGAQGYQYATALVLLMLVIAIYSVAIVIRYHYQKTLHW